jgi:hypothetical protein
VRNNADKYAYLYLAVSLFKDPKLKFWGQFNKYCLPNFSEKDVENAQDKLKAITDKMIKDIESH